MAVFEVLAPECAGTVNVITFRHKEKTYTISTTDISHLHVAQSYHDRYAGYTGILGNYETMLFIDQESMVYPFADMPGWPDLGVFQRYETEEAARDGHQDFVTRVQWILQRQSREYSMITPKHAAGESVRFRIAPWVHPDGPIFMGEITEAKHDDIRDRDYYHITTQIKGETMKGLIWGNEIIEPEE